MSILMYVSAMINMDEIEVRLDGVVVCVCKDESCLYPDEIMKDMNKFYQNGKVYKPEKK